MRGARRHTVATVAPHAPPAHHRITLLLAALAAACRPRDARPDAAAPTARDAARDAAPAARPRAPSPPPAPHALSCDDRLFVDDPALDWLELSVAPRCAPTGAERFCGADGIAAAFRAARDLHPDRPVRIWLERSTDDTPAVFAPRAGFDPYADPPRRTNLSLVGARRTAATPISLRARDPRPGRTVVNHTLLVVGCAYVALEGVTVGAGTDPTGRPYGDAFPLAVDDGVHVVGVAREPTRCGLTAGCNGDARGAPRPDVYGRYEPAHHVVLRGLTLQHLRTVTQRPTDAANATFEPVEPAELGAVSGIKIQQAEDVWVLDNRVDDVSRHGVDGVGVHRMVVCRNVIARTSADGYAIEAKGGATGVLYEANDITGTHGLALGGPGTDLVAVFPPSADYGYAFEAEGTVARRNRLRDPRRTALEFVGCRRCTAVDNEVSWSDGRAWRPDRAVRLLPSRFLARGDGAGDACTALRGDGPEVDFELVPRCWGVGSAVPGFTDRTGRSTARTRTVSPTVRDNRLTVPPARRAR